MGLGLESERDGFGERDFEQFGAVGGESYAEG